MRRNVTRNREAIEAKKSDFEHLKKEKRKGKKKTKKTRKKEKEKEEREKRRKKTRGSTKAEQRLNEECPPLFIPHSNIV